MKKKLEKKLKQIKDYLASKATAELTGVIKSSHPADVAEILNHLEREEKVALLDFLKPEEAARVLPEVDFSSEEELLASLEDVRLSRILEVMPPDSAADILGDLPEERERQVLKLMRKEEAEDVNRLLKYDEDTAGGIMTPDFLALPEEMKAGEAIEELRKSDMVEAISYVYVVNKKGHLLGILSLRNLIVASPLTPLKEIMDTEVVRVTTDIDQEEVANLVRKYNLRALPVVDSTNTLVGRVTVDDILDVVEEEASEDIYKMAGMKADDLLHRSIPTVTRLRLPWLIICLVGGLGSAGVIAIFEEAIAAVVVLVAFIPVIMGMGGNIGTQSTTIVTRGLATGNIDIKDAGRLLWRELRIGLLIGAICGVAVGVIAQMWKGTPHLGIVVGASMAATVVVAATLGAMLPILFQRFRVDPAVTSGPAITTIKDITGLLIYFGIATLIMGL